MTTPEAKYMRELRERRLAAGVCIYCEGELSTMTMCRKCADGKRSSTAPLVRRAKRLYPISRKSAHRSVR